MGDCCPDICFWWWQFSPVMVQNRIHFTIITTEGGEAYHKLLSLILTTQNRTQNKVGNENKASNACLNVCVFMLNVLLTLENSNGWETAGDYCSWLQKKQRHQHWPHSSSTTPYHQNSHPQLWRICSEQRGYRGNISSLNILLYFSHYIGGGSQC